MFLYWTCSSGKTVYCASNVFFSCVIRKNIWILHNFWSMHFFVSRKLYSFFQDFTRQRRVKYCRHCKNYVMGFDHHCPAFGNCIGNDFCASSAFSWRWSCYRSLDSLNLHPIVYLFKRYPLGSVWLLCRSKKSCSLYSAPGWFCNIWGILCSICFSMWVQTSLLRFYFFQYRYSWWMWEKSRYAFRIRI